MVTKQVQTPFLALLGRRDLADRSSHEGAFYPDGLRWRVDPGREISRLASRAMEACGHRVPWAVIEQLAITATKDLEWIAEQLSAAWRDEAGVPEMTATKLILFHGPAAMLASGRLWSLAEANPTTQIWSLVNVAPAKPKKRKGVDDGPQVLAAFALLMIDHAVDAQGNGQAATAMEFLSIGGSALAYATMDKAHSDAAMQLFNERSKINRPVVEARWAHLKDHRAQALELLEEGRLRGKQFPTRLAAARYVADSLEKSPGEFYTAETIDRWLRGKWKPAGTQRASKAASSGAKGRLKPASR